MDALSIFSYMITLLMAIGVWVCYTTVFTFIIWMAIDAGKQDKFFWMIIIIGIPLIGSIVYYFVEKKKDYMTTSGHWGHVHKSK